MNRPFHFLFLRSGPGPSGPRATARVPILVLCLAPGLGSASEPSTPRRGAPVDDPGTKAQTLDDLEKELRAPRPETRRSAVKKLAALGERKAWELVLLGLEDKDAQVADEAQIALGGLTDARFARDLLGRAGLHAQDAWVRLRTAEAFGRMGVGVDGEALAQAVSLHDAEVARTILWSMERLAAAKHLEGDREKLAHCAEKIAGGVGDIGARSAALETFATIDPLGSHALAVEMQGARESELRCAALLAAARAPEQECLTVSSRMLEDEEPSVRCVAIENLERLRSRAAVLALVDHMQAEGRARLKWGILGWLRAASGLDHGFDAQAWRSWAGTIEGPLSTGDGRGARLGPVGDTKVAFAGLELVSDHVCFLIDFSGSTWQTKDGDRTRKEVLDLKLQAALEALPEGTWFNVVPYTNEPIAWEKKLVPSTKPNVKRALDWFARCHQTGPGNFFDAALFAMADPEVDTIVVLTDGVPTGGHRWNLDLMVELLVEKNRFRRVAFDSVLVDAPKGRQKLWAELAERTGGRSVVARME